jgi:hypothetical protein
MNAVVLWIALSPVIGCAIGQIIGAGLVDRAASSRCTQACNQGRNCTCGKQVGARP